MVDPAANLYDSPTVTQTESGSFAIDLSPILAKLDALEASLNTLDTLTPTEQPAQSVDLSGIETRLANIELSLTNRPTEIPIDVSTILSAIDSLSINIQAIAQEQTEIKSLLNNIGAIPNSNNLSLPNDYAKETSLTALAKTVSQIPVVNLNHYATLAELETVASQILTPDLSNFVTQAQLATSKVMMMAKQATRPQSEWPTVPSNTAFAFGKYLTIDSQFNTGWSVDGFTAPQKGIYTIMVMGALYELAQDSKFIVYTRISRASEPTKEVPLQQASRAVVGGLSPEWAGLSGSMVVTLNKGDRVRPCMLHSSTSILPRIPLQESYSFFAVKLEQAL